MKKLLTLATVSALVALASVSWTSTNLNSLKGVVYRLAFENSVVSLIQPTAVAAQSVKSEKTPAPQTIKICKRTIPGLRIDFSSLHAEL